MTSPQKVAIPKVAAPAPEGARSSRARPAQRAPGARRPPGLGAGGRDAAAHSRRSAGKKDKTSAKVRLAAEALLSETMLAGTAEHSRTELAVELQKLGGALGAGIDSDRLAIVGSVLAPNLKQLLALLAEVIGSATYPKHEIAGERERMVSELMIARSQPSRAGARGSAHPALRQASLRDRAAGPGSPRRVSAKQLRALHSSAVSPVGAVLTLVGDLRPAAAIDAVELALSGWSGKAATSLPPLPDHVPGGVTIVDRPGAVQTNIRLGGPALTRTAPNYAALQVANVVFGGYFSSRLVNNIREDKGYTYSPRSGIEHAAVGSRFVVVG